MAPRIARAALERNRCAAYRRTRRMARAYRNRGRALNWPARCAWSGGAPAARTESDAARSTAWWPRRTTDDGIVTESAFAEPRFMPPLPQRERRPEGKWPWLVRSKEPAAQRKRCAASSTNASHDVCARSSVASFNRREARNPSPKAAVLTPFGWYSRFTTPIGPSAVSLLRNCRSGRKRTREVHPCPAAPREARHNVG